MNTLDHCRWSSLWGRLFPSKDPSPLFLELQTLYSAGNRYYHNCDHITDCLRELDSERSAPADRSALELAIWFHDAIYDSTASDNEQRSAALAHRSITAAGGPESLAAVVRSLVLATKTHDHHVGVDAPWMIDIDLCIFGKAEAEFDAYEAKIRAEYSWVEEREFRVRRAAILERFLSRPILYATPPFRAKYENSARANLLRSITQLRSNIV